MMTQGGNPLHDGKAMLEHVVTVVLKQAKDGPLSKALARGGIHDISDVVTLMQPARDALTYLDDNGTVKPLSVGHKSILRTLKIFANYCEAEGSPIVDWTVITKEDFDDFRCSQACMHATEMDDTIAPATIPVTIPKNSPSADGDQGDFGPTDGEAALQHILSEVFNPGWREKLPKHCRVVGSMRFKIFFS